MVQAAGKQGFYLFLTRPPHTFASLSLIFQAKQSTTGIEHAEPPATERPRMLQPGTGAMRAVAKRLTGCAKYFVFIAILIG